MRGGVYVAPSRVNGHGVFAGRLFRAGERLFLLTGDELTKAQILTGGEEHAANAYQIDDDLYIYPLNPEGRFANHSCEPNAGLWEDREMIALRDIEAGEEIVLDYSTTMSEQHWTMGCTCASAACRGLVGDFHELPKSLQQRYLRLGVVQRFIVREIFERAAVAIRQGRGPSAGWSRAAADAAGMLVAEEDHRGARADRFEEVPPRAGLGVRTAH
ncbi:MAG: SET domain-containing protein [Verrucomicrobiales bacterium]